MTILKSMSIALLATSVLVSCQADSAKDSANNFARAWCITGGPIYTANDKNPVVEAVAIRKGTITYAGPIKVIGAPIARRAILKPSTSKARPPTPDLRMRMAI